MTPVTGTVLTEPAKNPSHRPSRYDPKYCDLILEHFHAALEESGRRMLERETEEDDIAPDPTPDPETGKPDPRKRVKMKGSLKREVRLICSELPTIESFGISVGVSSVTLWRWAQQYPAFGECYQRAKDIQCHLLTDRGLTGRYNPQSFIFVAKNLTHMKDRSEVEVAQQAQAPAELANVPTAVLEQTRAQLLEMRQRLLTAATPKESGQPEASRQETT